MKKILLYVVFVVLILCSFSAGFYYCKEEVIHGENSLTSKNMDRIAIVNLDGGIFIDGEKVLYSSHLLKFASDYTYIGLNEAQRGLEADMYAAYIVIPSDFSECIESINGTPKQVKVEYVMNTGLTDQNRLDIAERLSVFKELLNADTAYVYLSSVLNEFHDVQDSALTIMEHDKIDLENIQKINPESIFNMIDFSEMKETENDITNVDLTEYINKNSVALSNVISEIDKGITDGRQEYYEVTKDYNLVSTEIENIRNTMEYYDPLTDEEGNAIYQRGLDNLDKAIDEYNENIGIGEADGIETLKSDMADIVQECIEDALNEAQKYTDERLLVIQNGNKDIVNEKVSIWKAGQDDCYRGFKAMLQGMAERCWDNHKTQTIEVVDNIMGEGNKLIGKINQLGEDTISKNETMALVQNYVVNICAKTEDTLNQNISPSIDFFKYEEFQQAFQNDEIVLPEVESLHEEKSAEESQEVIVTQDESLELDRISIDIDEEIEIEKKVSEYVAKKNQDIEEIMNAAKSDVQISKTEITDIINEQIIGSITDENQQEITAYHTVTENLLNSMQSYNDKITGFNPYDYIKKQEITKYQTELSQNITALGNAMNKKSAEYIEFVNKLYGNTNQNINTLQGDMQKANNASKEELNTVIKKLKENKESITLEDNEILESFSEKLPYTRMGTLEYAEMQKFMVTPVTLFGQADEKEENAAGDTDKIHLDYAGLISLAVIVLVVVFVINLMIKIIQGRKELKNLTDGEYGEN